MKLKKFIRFSLLFLFLVIASIVPFPIKLYKKDKLPTSKIELIDKKEDTEYEKEEYEAFS